VLLLLCTEITNVVIGLELSEELGGVQFQATHGGVGDKGKLNFRT
jgi:hypothetical protein